MKFKKDDTLCNFDVFPKVLVAGKKAELNIVNLGYRQIFIPGKDYTLTITGYTGGNPRYYPETADCTDVKVTCNERGGFKFSHTFQSEQEYRIRVRGADKRGREETVILSVYCVEGDLVGRYPFIGDLHLHSNFSDGRQTPETVAAVYRSIGYDFLAVTDHHRYYPSLRAVSFFKDVPTELTVVPGEEVQLPDICERDPNAHIINFGGEYSINSLIEDIQVDEVGTDPEYRSLYGECPDVMKMPVFEDMIRKRAETLTVPKGINKIQAAVYTWIYDEIRKSNGLGIFVHPTWITGDTFHVPDILNDYFVNNKVFDAFEVLGGELYYEQNGYQTVRYYEDKAKGNRYPVVGSTDSHCCYEYNDKAYICSTIVFSKENERTALIDSIKNFYSVAVDTISKEFRLVGDMRLVRYGCFLLNNYFPFHDELCFEEGRLLAQYANGTDEEKEEAIKTLKCINGRVERLRRKYFDF